MSIFATLGQSDLVVMQLVLEVTLWTSAPFSTWMADHPFVDAAAH